MRTIINREGETLVNNFGSTMIITTYRNTNDIDVYFPEYEWTAEHVKYGHFSRGMIRCPYERRVYGVGYIGEGPHRARENGEITKAYRAWHDMMKRAYNPKHHEKCPTYMDCTVHPDWHNYQVFHEWFDNNYYEIEGHLTNLDKDILIKGNKQYGPTTCILVPDFINTLFVKCDALRGELPIGVSYDDRTSKYVSFCRVSGKKKNLGYYDTSEEAFYAYKTFKEAHIKKVANDYIEYIPFELYEAMLEYEVEIDD